MSHDIKWTPGLPPEPQEEKMYLIFCRNQKGFKWTELLLGEELVGTQQESIKAHALINYPLSINEAVTYDDATSSWICWDINGVGFHTGLATREEAETAYRDEYGDW